jgi:glutamate-1-semialdehyde aminotransferase
MGVRPIKLYNNINMNKRALESIAHGALTNSKRPSTFVEGVYPSHISQAFKCYLHDVDGNRYIDFVCGLGTNLFGYANPEICRSVTRALQSGNSVYSLASREEVEYAEKVKEIFPFIERLRFLKTGSEGCSAAVRIARAFTGRDRVLQQGYSGWHDQFVSLTPPAKGIVDNFNIETLEDIREPEQIAAIILEPVITSMSSERVVFLQALRELCTKAGIVLIFDETITAYRFPEYSVAKYLNILPDLWIGGKAVGGGLPISIVGGRKGVMEADYFVSSTWGGDRLACVAGLTAIDLIYNDFKVDELWTLGRQFLDNFNSISEEVKIEGYPTRGVFKYKSESYKALFMQELCKAGVLIGPSWFYNKHLHVEMDNVLSIVKTVDKKIKAGEVRLEGKPPQSPFAERVRKNA